MKGRRWARPRLGDQVAKNRSAREWEVGVDDHGEWVEVLACGVFTDQVVSHLGGDPTRHIAMGAGYGLERFAMLRYGIDDIRKVDVARVA